MKKPPLVHNITGGDVVNRTADQITTKNGFWAGFRAGLAVLGTIVGILLLIFWF